MYVPLSVIDASISASCVNKSAVILGIPHNSISDSLISMAFRRTTPTTLMQSMSEPIKDSLLLFTMTPFSRITLNGLPRTFRPFLVIWTLKGPSEWKYIEATKARSIVWHSVMRPLACNWLGSWKLLATTRNSCQKNTPKWPLYISHKSGHSFGGSPQECAYYWLLQGQLICKKLKLLPAKKLWAGSRKRVTMHC